MTSTVDDRRTVQLTRRLSVLPAAVGLLGVIWALVGAWAGGVTDGGSGGVIAVAVAALVGATVISGSGAGLYAGLGLLAVATLGGGDGRLERRELLALGLALVVVHETVRFSLDARRPARLGPGLVGGFLARTAAVAAAVAGATLLLDRLTEAPVEHPLWIPIGLAAAGVPVLALAVSARHRDARMPRTGLRVSLAVAGTFAVLALAVLGATARSTIDTSVDRTDTPTAAPTTTTLPAADGRAGPDQPAEFRRGLTLVFLIAATLILGAVYLALRRPEAVFELDDLDYDEDDTSFGLAPPGRADTESTVDVDDHDLARLLADLRLDIETEADPGRAVRFAYANVERRLADLDLPRRPEETEREFLERALAAVDEDGGALTQLTELFERARFGTGGADEPMRQRALYAIGELERVLRPPTDGQPPSAAGAAEPDRASGSQPTRDDGPRGCPR